jgi:uncharacterized protein involved in exopolysaccharide biosynthesis/Mrp family chromosome partitioning ATPase
VSNCIDRLMSPFGTPYEVKKAKRIQYCKARSWEGKTMNNASAVVRRYWKQLLLLNGFLVTATAFNAIYSARTWQANAQLILPDTSTNLNANLGTLGELREQGVAFTNELSPLKVQASIITSNDVISSVWESDPEREKFTSLESYRKLFRAKPIDQATTIQVEVTGSQPELAQERVEKLISSYQKRLNELRQGTSAARQRFSQDQLTQAERDLARAKDELAAFQRATGLVNSEEQAKNLDASINTLVAIQAQIAAQGQAAQTRTGTLATRLNLSPAQAINSLKLSQNKEYQSLRTELTEVEAELATRRGTFTDRDPQVAALLAQREELRAAISQQISALVPTTEGLDLSFGGNSSRDGTVDLITQLIQAESDGRSYQQQANQIQQRIDQLKGSLSTIAVQQSKLLDLQRRYEIAEGLYKGLVAQLGQTRLTAFDSYPNVQVLDQPSVNPKPISPRLSFILLGGLLSSLLGSVALVSFMESRNPFLKPKDIENSELPVLVRIPQMKQTAKALAESGLTEVEFQRLASKISLMQLSNRRLLVSSSINGEGKTTVALVLAMALVELGFRVLLVDTDFYKAELSQRLGYSLSSEVGCLSNPVPVRSRLDLLPAAKGTQQKALEFVGRGQFEQHLDAIQANGNYDYVIVDSAPIGLTSETTLIAKAIQNVLMIVRLGVSDRQMVQEAMEQLIRQETHVIGLAVNGVEQRETYRYELSRSQSSS